MCFESCLDCDGTDFMRKKLFAGKAEVEGL